MTVRLYAYPTDSHGRVPIYEAMKISQSANGWAEHVDPSLSDLDLVALAFRWASEGQAVRIEIN